MRIQVCGRIAIERDGRRIEDQLPGRQGRMLFAYLVANRLRPITRSELVDAVWSDRPPAASETALSALMSKLRRVLGPETVPSGPGVRLELPSDVRVDLEVAYDAVHRAESAISLEEWGRAWGAAQVAMFTARRGFLPGEESPWIDELRRDLEEVHLRALEAYATASLGIGGTELAAAERVGRELIARAPYRESGYRYLMNALARKGNLAEALRLYDRLVRRLREELGIVPSTATRELHERLLREGHGAPGRAS